MNIGVIITTYHRPEKLRRALESVASQIRPADAVFVVREVDDMMASSIIAEHSAVEVVNSRGQGLACAANSGFEALLSHVISERSEPPKWWMAMLDDDDWWESDHLSRCSIDVDFVITGLVRHDEGTPNGHRLTIPNRLHIDDFLVTNPGIQGSNLFVRLNCLLRAGGFDESLASTTDRDVMIRLIEANSLSIASTSTWTVHHDARDSGRISDAGGERKKRGLSRFLEKHRGRMTDDQYQAFIERSLCVFGVSIDDAHVVHGHDTPSTMSREPLHATPFTGVLTVGWTTNVPGRSKQILQGLKTMQGGMSCHLRAVVVLREEAQADAAGLRNEVNIEVVIRTDKEMQLAADVGRFGPWFEQADRRCGIAWGRSCVHRAILRASQRDLDGAAWIIDDDIELSSIAWGNGRFREVDVDLGVVVGTLRKQNVMVGVGAITGAPPLPAWSSVRTQLIDAHASALNCGGPIGALGKWKDAYYDLTWAHTDHLEFGINHEMTSDELDEALKQITLGTHPFRNARSSSGSHPWFDETAFVVRGGNTIVTDLRCLRHHLNAAPIVDGVAMRRSDSLWALLNRMDPPEGASGKVCYVPLHIGQLRQPTPLVNNAKSLIDDIRGASVLRALHSHSTITSPMQSLSRSIHNLTVFSNNMFHRRRTIAVSSTYRILGLIFALEGLIPLDSSARPALRQLSSSANIVVKELLEVTTDIEAPLSEFIRSLENDAMLMRRQQPQPLRSEHVSIAKSSVERLVGPGHYELVGSGAEGIVFRFGDVAVKWFRCGEKALNQGQRAFILDMSQQPDSALPTNVKWISDGNDLVCTYDFVTGHAPISGCWSDLVDLHQHMRRCGWMTEDFRASNLIQTGNGLVCTDLGHSLVPWSYEGEDDLVARMVLTGRFGGGHIAKNIRLGCSLGVVPQPLELMLMFRSILKPLSKESTHDRIFFEEILKLDPTSALDIGCGRGEIALQMAKEGWKVDAWDPDSSGYPDSDGNSVRFLRSLTYPSKHINPKGYDLVIASLVFCVVEDDEEFDHLIDHITKAVSEQGRLLVSFCHPNAIKVRRSPLMIRNLPQEIDSNLKIVYTKTMHTTGACRKDVHRPLSSILEHLRRRGFGLVNYREDNSSVDVDAMKTTSDWIVLTFQRLPPDQAMAIIPESNGPKSMFNANDLAWFDHGPQHPSSAFDRWITEVLL